MKFRFTGGTGKYPPVKFGIYHNSIEGVYSSEVLTTNLDKPLEFKKIAAGKYHSSAICPDGFELIPDLPYELDVIPNESVTIDVPLVKPIQVSGQIETSTGEPIAGVRISVQHAKNYASVSVVTDSNGKFEANVIPGRVTVSVISYRMANYYSDKFPRLTFEDIGDEDHEFAPIKVKAKPRQ